VSNEQLRTFGITFASGIVYVMFVPALLQSITGISTSWWLLLGFALWGLAVWTFTVRSRK